MGNILQKKVKFTILIVTLAIGVCTGLALTTKSVLAADWSWTDRPPSVFEKNDVSGMAGNSQCQFAPTIKNVKGYKKSVGLCATSGYNIIFGGYFEGQIYKSVVGFSNDADVYPFASGLCNQYDNCLYLPGTDSLVTKQYLINGYVKSLVVYKNFSKRLKANLNEDSHQTQFMFDDSKPDYIFKNSAGYQWPVGGFGASKNGRWLAFEMRQRGVAILDLNTLDVHQITQQSFLYGWGRDPHAELSISNSGRQIAVMGDNAGFAIYEVNENCGYNIDDTAQLYLYPNISCKTSSIDTSEYVHRFYEAVHPRFNDDGGEITFYVISFSDDQKEVTLRAAGYNPPQLDYLALGDSFSSGEGETSDLMYDLGTNDKFEKCHNSLRSYPYLLSTYLGINGPNMSSVACSGATMNDIVGSDISYWGQNTRLGKGGEDLNISQKTLSQTTAKEKYIPGRVHQIDFVSKYHPKVITIGIGGNDAGFMQKLKACVGPGTCEWAKNSEDKESTALELQSLFIKFVNTYTEIHNASPSSKIYVIGYPKIIDSSNSCTNLTSTLLDPTERDFMNQGIVYINNVMSAASKAAGVRYIDIENSLGSGVLCGSMRPSVMNGVRVGDDDGLTESTNWLKVIGQESFHPKPTGHRMMFDAIISQVPSLTTYQYCSNGIVVCRQNTTIPNPSDYWLKDGKTHGYGKQQVLYFMNDAIFSSDSENHTVLADDYSFTPESTIHVEIHSDPKIVGDYKSNKSGGADFKINLPTDLTDGYHTVHLTGLDYAGEPIDYYEVIKYQHSETVQLPVSSNIEPKHDGIKPVSGQTAPPTQLDNSIQIPAVLGSYTSIPSSVEKPLEHPTIGTLPKYSSNSTTIPVVVWVCLGLACIIFAPLFRFIWRRQFQH